jgi:hypothetical protein
MNLIFLTLFYFCIVLFVKVKPNPTTKKFIRNNIYKLCGYAMLFFIIMIALYSLLTNFYPDHSPKIHSLIFWLESIAIVAFGFSWLVKGEAILKDVT